MTRRNRSQWRSLAWVRNLVDRGLPRLRAQEMRRLWAVALVVTIALGLGLAALRIDVIKLRYALAQAERTERSLRQQQRSLVVAVRGLRDPAVLAETGRSRGFGPPSRVIEVSSNPAHPVPDVSAQ